MILIPLQELTSSIDLAVEVDGSTARGFIIRETNTFILDVSRSEIVLKGQPSRYDPDLVKELLGEIYVESDLLSKWFDMQLDVDLFSATVTIHSAQKLPFLERMEREQNSLISLSRTARYQKYYPRHHESLQKLSFPSLDLTVNLGQAGSDQSINYSNYLTADLLGLESQLFFSGDDNEPTKDVRLTLARRDPAGELLGPLRAREFSFFNVVEPRVDLINKSAGYQKGFAITNYSLGRQLEFDRHRFQGDLLEGWEVELYRNNSLIGYQNTATGGQYDFQDVPLLYGDNYFRFVFYGPQGQIREEEQRFQLGDSLTRKGEFNYRFVTMEDEVESYRSLLQMTYGLGKNLAMGIDLLSLPLSIDLERQRHNYSKLSLLGSLSSTFFTLEAINDSEGGNAFEFDVQGRLGSSVVEFSDLWLRDFVSEEISPGQRRIIRRTGASVSSSISSKLLPRIPISFDLERERFADGNQRDKVSNRLSISARKVALTNQLTYEKASDQVPSSNGSLQLSTSFKKIRLRGNMSYVLKPEREVTNASVSIDPGSIGSYKYGFNINHSLSKDSTNLSASVSKRSSKYTLGLTASYDTEVKAAIDLSFSIGFGYEPRHEHWRSTANTVASMGSLSSLVFLDTDQDGIFGSDDEPLPDASFTVNGGFNKELTDDDGIAFLTGLSTIMPVDIALDTGSLEDPSWTPAIEGVQILPRPGHTIRLDFPVFLSGEVDGSIYLRHKDGRELPAGNIDVELVDEFGNTLKSERTAYDGFYIISGISMGSYWIRVGSDQLMGTEYDQPPAYPVTVSAEELFINGIDFVIGQKYVKPEKNDFLRAFTIQTRNVIRPDKKEFLRAFSL